MKIFLICLLTLISAVARGDEPNPQGALKTVVADEGKFYQMGQEQGTRAAFLAFLAEDGIVFQPGPVNGQEAWKKRPEKGLSITWKPLFAAISRSADLAYTTGPAEWKHNKEDEKPFGYGQFVSIWKKQKDGSWKVALDVGSEVPGPAKNEDPLHLEIITNMAPPDQGKDAAPAHRRLHTAEAKFAEAAKTDSTIALGEASAPEVRVQREGVFPALGQDPAQLMLSVRRGKLAMDQLGGGMSAAGDLAYGYGKYSLVKPQETERGYYLQIWRTDNDGTWRLALDYQEPLPPGEKKAKK